MKLKYETRCKAIGANETGHAGYGGWTEYTTSAKTVDGLMKRMTEEAEKKLERRIRFYEDCPDARKSDIYDEDHVWVFHTYAPLKNGSVLRFEAYAVKHDGVYGPIDIAYTTGHDDFPEYARKRGYYEELCA